MLVFSKEKMLKRVQDSGLSHLVTEKEEAIMNQLDGLEALPNLWRQTVYGDDNAYYCVLNGQQYPVNGRGCIEK